MELPQSPPEPPKTVTVRILVAVDREGKACASSENCGNFYVPGTYSDDSLIAGVVEENGYDTGNLTLRFIDVQLPVPMPQATIKTLTVKDT